MITPCLRMVSVVLQDPDLGVGAFLDAMIPDENDKMPETPTVLNAADDDAAVGPTAEGSVSNLNYPLLLVASGEQTAFRVTGVVGRAFDVPSLILSIPYITGNIQDRSLAWNAADYTFRAVCHSLNAGLFASNTEAARVRGKVMIIKHNSISYGPAFLALTNGWIIGELRLDLQVRVNP